VSDSSIGLANSNQPNPALASPAGAFCFAQAAAPAGQVEPTGTKLEPNLGSGQLIDLIGG
jgi:hypothetical protein